MNTQDLNAQDLNAAEVNAAGSNAIGSRARGSTIATAAPGDRRTAGASGAKTAREGTGRADGRPAAAAARDGDGILAGLAAPLVARLSARISSSLDEVVAFPSAARAIEAVAEAFLGNRSVALAEGTPADLASAAASRARTTSTAPWIGTRPDGVLAALVAGTVGADAVVLASPVVASDGRGAAIAPRELLQLRARNLRSLLVVDLRDEDLARSPLTQTALLLPGTIAIRGFGEVWRAAGAPEVADLAFVAGPSREIAALRPRALGNDGADRAIVEAACAALDRSDIDRRVREVAAGWRCVR